MEAKVPIACGFIDYGTRTGGFLSDVIHPTGNIEQDFLRFQKAYAKITPKFPAQMSPIRPPTARVSAAATRGAPWPVASVTIHEESAPPAATSAGCAAMAGAADESARKADPANAMRRVGRRTRMG